MNARYAVAVFLAAVFSSSTRADIPDDNLIVSGYRTPAQRTDVGSAVSVISQVELENRQTIFITDALQDLPGVAASRSGNVGSQTQLRIRGAEANHVLVRIDGIEMNDSAAADEFGWAHLTAWGLGRIELVRGPQSALWGSDALSGVIDIRTERAREPFEASGFLEAGSFGTTNGGVRIGTATDKGGISLATSYLDTDGENVSRQGSEKDGYRNFTTSLNGDWQIADAFMTDVSVRYTDSRKDFDADTDFDGLPDDADRRIDKQQIGTRLGGRLELFDERWTQSLHATYLGTENDNIENGVPTTKSDIDKYGVYYQSDLQLGKYQSVSLAGDFEREDFRQRGQSLWGDPNQDQSMNNIGIAAEYRARDIGGLSFGLGLRHDANNRFRNVTTYRAAGAYRLKSLGARLHASLGTGQKKPTFSERFGFFAGQFRGNPNLKPEKSLGLDFGYEQSLVGERIVTDITYFRSRTTDEIDGNYFDINAGSYTAINLDGTSRRRGIEFDIVADITGALAIAANYTYTNASQPGSSGRQEREIRRPRHMGAFNANYNAWGNRLQANLNVSYTGRQRDFDFGAWPAQTVTLDAYTLVNVAARFSVSNQWAIIGRIENLLDEEYENVYGFRTTGIGAYVGARLEFEP